jgi:hypothetical protein
VTILHNAEADKAIDPLLWEYGIHYPKCYRRNQGFDGVGAELQGTESLEHVSPQH